MKKKIIFLQPYSIIKFDYERFGVDFWESHGYEVEIWMLKRILSPQDKSEEISFYKVIYIKDIKELRKCIKDNRNALYFDWIGHNDSIKRVWLRMIMTYYKVNFCIFNISAIPYDDNIAKIENKAGVIEFFKRQIQHVIKHEMRGILENVLRLIFIQVIIPIYLVKNPPQYLFLPASQNIRSVPIGYRNSPIVYTHAADYDKYLMERKFCTEEKELLPNNYMVFIDQGATIQRDTVLLGGKNTYESKELKDEYFFSICNFFERLEKKYECPVVIAVHPRANYNGEEFGGRKLIKNQTQALIRNAHLVIVGYSTAMDYIVLYKKPFIMLYDRYEMKPKGLLPYYSGFQKIFKVPICDFRSQEIEQDIIDKYVKTYDETYDNYRRNFIIDESSDPDLLFWEKVYNAISE